eukprot:jgi/Ulvmu1/2488/UM137_0014.1
MRALSLRPRGARQGSLVTSRALQRGHLNVGSTATGPSLAAVVQRSPFPKGYRLFRVRQKNRSGASSVDVAPESIEAEFNSGVIKGVHHVALLCEDLETSMDFYVRVLGLTVNPHRPDDKLPYRGAWLNIGPEMIHLMELPNPDDLDGRPEHGGRDRHFCMGIDAGGVTPLMERLDQAGIEYTKSKSGRPAIFFRDPDMNCLEAVEISDWRA